MQEFTNLRQTDTKDELWLVEHPPVFTQGQAGKSEHILHRTNILLVQTDRGGQVTYHGPGQLVAYPLLDLKRLKLNVRDLVTLIECSVVRFLRTFGIESTAQTDAPGVYVNKKKVASLGLRIRRGCSYHGVAINVSGDLEPFLQINPCGYAGLEMVRMVDLLAEEQLLPMNQLMLLYSDVLADALGLTPKLLSEPGESPYLRDT